MNRLTHTRSTADLPELFSVIAGSSKKNERVLIQEHLHTVGLGLGIPRTLLLVTPDLAKKLTLLRFDRHNMDNLSDGIHPFLTVIPSPGLCAALVANINAYDSVIAGARLANLTDLKESQRIALSATILQAVTVLSSFRVLLHAILGSGHTLILAHDPFVAEFLAAASEELEPLCTTPDIPAKLLRWVQICLSWWFTEQYRNPHPVPPPISWLSFATSACVARGKSLSLLLISAPLLLHATLVNRHHVAQLPPRALLLRQTLLQGSNKSQIHLPIGF